MPFLVQATADDHTLAVTTETATEAFEKAIEWQVVERFTNISINDGTKSYTVAEFSSVMALKQIANTVGPPPSWGRKRRLNDGAALGHFPGEAWGIFGMTFFVKLTSTSGNWPIFVASTRS